MATPTTPEKTKSEIVPSTTEKAPEQYTQAKAHLVDYIKGAEELDSKTKEEFLQTTQKLAEKADDGDSEAMNTLRRAALTEDQYNKNPLLGHQLLSALYLERKEQEKDSPQFRFTVNFKNNQLAEWKVGAGDLLPANVVAIKVLDAQGDVITERAFRATNPKTGRIGYYKQKNFDESGAYEYVPVFSGYEIIVLETKDREDPEVKRREFAEGIELFHPPARNIDDVQAAQTASGEMPPPRSSPRGYREAFDRLQEEPRFLQRITEIAGKIGCKPEHLLQIMWKESGLDPRAVNRQSGDSNNPYERAKRRATGLIQFMPKTARGLGTTTQEIYNMSALQQLDYVEKYFQPYFGRIHDFMSLYWVVFYPAALGKPDNFVLGSQIGQDEVRKIAMQNSGVARGKDHVTVQDFRRFAMAGLPPELGIS